MQLNAADLRPENAALRQELAVKNAQMGVLDRLNKAQSLQQMVSRLAAYLAGEAVTVCSLWLYNTSPTIQGMTVELAGMWIQNQTDIVEEGIGIRLDIAPGSRVIHHIQQNEALHSKSWAESNQPDPLLQTLLKTQKVSHWALYGLHRSGRSLGFLFVGGNSEGEGLTDTAKSILEVTAPLLAMATHEEVLRREKHTQSQELQTVLGAVEDALLVTLITPDHQRLQLFNASFQTLFRCERAYPGMSLADLVVAMDISVAVKQQLHHIWKPTAQNQTAQSSGEFEMYRVNGQPRQVRWTRYDIPATVPGTVAAQLYVFRDVTANHTADYMRASFLRRISHELRTPLTPIKGFAESILQMSENLSSTTEEYLGIIYDSASKLDDLFTELIELTGLDSGSVPLQLTSIQLEDTALAVIRNYEKASKIKGQRLTLKVVDNLPPIQADVELISRVFAHLIHNAITYAPNDDTITVSISYVPGLRNLPEHAPADAHAPALMVSVQDNGAGIPPADTERVFQPFYRATHKTSSMDGGVGLGLALTQSIIRRHQGCIWVDPTFSQKTGGHFFFTLPITS